MKYALSCVNGELKYNLTKKELMGQLIRETKSMGNDDILIVYPMVDGSKIRIAADILAVHLLNGELDVYDVKDAVLSTLYNKMSYRVYYNKISEVLDAVEKKQPVKESRAFEQEQFEQAEAEKEYAEYTVSVYGKSLSFSGETAYNSVLDLILAVVSTEDDETGVITVEKDGRGFDIGCAKGKYNIFLRVSDDHCKWEIFEKGDRIAISKFLREWVIL